MSSSNISHQSNDRVVEDDEVSLHFDDSDDENLHAEEHAGDYSTRMDELFEGGEDEVDSAANVEDDEDEEDEGFVYDGVDATEDTSHGYREQLRDVLGLDLDDKDNEHNGTHEAEESDDADLLTQSDGEPLRPSDASSSHSPSTSSIGPTTPPSRGLSPAINSSQFKLAHPFLHPTVSRLRSYTPQNSRIASDPGASTLPHSSDGPSPSPSRFSSLSRVSSLSNLQTISSIAQKEKLNGSISSTARDTFKWNELQKITLDMYRKKAPKATSVLGNFPMGSPTVLAANGLICIGTNEGRVCIYDFKQTLICVCGTGQTDSAVGPVTALALSYDHTYVASGHATGHIQIFDLKSPQNPVRFVPPTTLSAVSSGRNEGHLQGSRIVNIGFVASRHTAIVSADEHGLAFFHSLGKVLFIEASDVLRILGRYPEKPPLPAQVTSIDPQNPRKARYTILSMAPLPLGTSPHNTDAYNIVALLTPTKLVVVGLKPTPRTWFKCPRDVDEGGSWSSPSKMKGTLAWFPCVLASSSDSEVRKHNDSQALPESYSNSSNPTLVLSWGNALRFIRIAEEKIKRNVRSSKTGKAIEMEVGVVVFEHVTRWSTDEDILAVQWLNANQVVLLTASMLGVFDLNANKLIERAKFDGLSLVSPTLDNVAHQAITPVAHSIRVYKGKIFILGKERLQVGTVLTWADRILSFVQEGDFLSAIELTQSYYNDTAPGNRNGLPIDPEKRKEIVGERMQGLMAASAQYAFSEDRMTDGTHVTADGRGVDRTFLFEGLVTVCCRACIALNDFDFLFEDLFQKYDDSGILSIYLRKLEPFILDNSIRYVPPRITQRLVSLHSEDGHPDYVENIIWHIDPACLDINQVIQICQRHHLYDALIYVYMRALRDFVAPIVELLGLIRQVLQHKKARSEMNDLEQASELDPSMESIIVNAYKIFPYLANVLSGLTYPSEEPLPEDEALQAKEDIYGFLFNGPSSVWPLGESGKLVLTADEEGGFEPTYPYTRQLIRFDSESFLHSLDIAFEDSYLNDSHGIDRHIIIRILLEILSTVPSDEDATFINIFIARNVPKYPQFLEMSPRVLQGVLMGLAKAHDPNTREDRQLAAEYLLSMYTPHDIDEVISHFQSAGFYRILRSWHRQEKRWAELLSTYLDDPNLRPGEVLEMANEVLIVASSHNKGTLRKDVVELIATSIPRLLQTSIALTASLLDQHAPTLHEDALLSFGSTEIADQQRFTYLDYLLGPLRSYEDDYSIHRQDARPSIHIPKQVRHQYISLHCRYRPKSVINTLKHLPFDFFGWNEIIDICESAEVFDAVIWAKNKQCKPYEAFAKAEIFQKKLSLRIAGSLAIDKVDTEVTKRDVELLEDVGRIGMSICLEYSRETPATTDIPLEDIWFQLLSGQINSIQVIVECYPREKAQMDGTENAQTRVLSSLRSLVQSTFGALVSVTSTRAVSFPRLFKRLVNSAPTSTGTHYTEFRTILTSMLETYRSDGDMLVITKHLMDRDLFDVIAEIARERTRGWSPSRGICIYCKKPLLDTTQKNHPSSDNHDTSSSHQVVISRTGTIYHSSCLPVN